MAPAYLAADCQFVSAEGCRQLRSATSRKCVVNLSDGPTATMETGVLQLQVRNCGTAFQLFKRLLKTFLFGW